MLELLMKLFTYKIETSKPVIAVSEAFEGACGAHGFALLHHYVYHEVVAAKGFPITRKVFVYEVCQAKVASMLLEEQPAFAPFMPCRVALYEAKGKTVIATQNMALMLFALKKNRPLYRETTALFQTLKSMMQSLQ
jgi:uncharacterized protein (DUF302 family)